MTRSSIRIAPRPQMPTTDSNDNQGTSAPDLRDQRKRRRATLAEQEKRATAVKTEKERVFISYEQPKRSRGRPRKYPKATVGAEQTIVPSNPTRIAPAPIPPGTAGPSGPSGTSGTSGASGTSSAPSPPSASSASSAPSAPSMPLPPSTPTAVTYYSHTNYVPAPPPSSITGTAASAMRLETAASAPAPTPSPITVSAVSATRLETAASAPAPTPSPITVSAASDTRLETAASAPAPPYPSSAHDAHQISEFDSFMQYKKLHTPCPPIKQDVDESLAPDNQHEKAANEVELVAIKPEPMAAPSPSYTKMSSKRKAAQRATPRPASIPSDTCVVWVAATHNVFIIYESSDLGKSTLGIFENDRDADFGYFLAAIHILQQVDPSTPILVQSQCRQLTLSRVPYPHVQEELSRLTSDREGSVQFQYVPKRERSAVSTDAENAALMAQSTLHSILDAIEESSSVEDQGMDEAALMPDAIERTLEDLKQLQQTSSMIPSSMSIICVSEPKESSVEPDAELGTDEANVDEPSAEQTNKAENKQKDSSQSIEMGPEPEQEAEFEPQAGLANDTGAIHPLSSQVQHQQQPHHPCPTCGNGTTSSNGSIRATSTTDAQLLQQVEQLQRDMACLMDLVRKERMDVSLYGQSTAENSERDDMSSVEQESQETRRSDEPQQAKGRPSNADDNRGSIGTLGRAWSLLRSPFSYIGP